MAEIQNYQVNYTIDVKTNGIQDVTKFAEAINKLKISEKGAEAAITQVKNMVNKMDAIFKPKGRKRDVNYNVNVKTDLAEEKLDKVLRLIKDIQTEAAKINLVVNAGQKLDSQAIKAQAKAVLKNQELAAQEEAKKSSKKTASQAMEAMREPIKAIDKTIGKINAALVSLETGREINIKTDVAKKKLEEILSLLGQIKGATNMTLGTNMVSPPAGSGSTAITPVISNTVDSDKASPRSSIQRKVSANENKTIKEAERELKRLARESEKEFKRQDREYTNLWNKIEKEQEREYRANVKKKLDNFRRISKEMEESQKRYEKYQEYSMASQLKREAKQEKEARHRQRIAEREYYSRQKGAINRLQYSRLPSWGNMPFAGMFSAYAGYSVFKSELADAVEYANIMETARSILRVADSDLSTFEERFDKMAKNVRQIGIDTKFTATEIAGATKFLAMAGMDIDTINKSMRPITDLALIGDTDVAQIADLATNIMSGYDINSSSMKIVSDILASTMARSNVNILEMAESFKMASGYLRLSGVDFSEASAAIGILGNSGMKGTMAGTALRAMSGRFAKPTKEAQDTIDRLGIKFTEKQNVYGKQIEKLRSLSDIFEDLNKSGATLGDMQAIFGKIGGNAAMMFLDNYEALRTLTAQNRSSNGVANELALKKQNTTKGLWDQMTSQFSESFMQAYEEMEPVIRGTLKDFVERFKPREFVQGIKTIGSTLLDVFTILGRIGTWFAKNMSWIEPIFVTGFVAIKIFKLAGALTNFGVALGLIGKQRAAVNVLGATAGVLGGTTKGAGGIIGRVSSMFASNFSTGAGVFGAGASLAALGGAATALTGGLAVLAGAFGYAAWKAWQLRKETNAIIKDIDSKEKYRYPSIEALRESLSEAYTMAKLTNGELDKIDKNKTVEESTNMPKPSWFQEFVYNMGRSNGTPISNSLLSSQQKTNNLSPIQQWTYNVLLAAAKERGQELKDKIWGQIAQIEDRIGLQALYNTLDRDYKIPESVLNGKYYWTDKQGKVHYPDNFDKFPEAARFQVPYFRDYINKEIIDNDIKNGLAELINIKGSQQKAMDYILSIRDTKTGETVKNALEKVGMTQRSVDGKWVPKALGENPTEQDRIKQQESIKSAHLILSNAFAALKRTFGGQTSIAEYIMNAASFTAPEYSNEPNFNDKDPWNKNGITYQDKDDGGAGGNYSGTGKLSSAAPKQVVVNITNLLSIQTVELMKTPEGKTPEMQDLKEMMAQALIDVVHDFDASWNG